MQQMFDKGFSSTLIMSFRDFFNKMSLQIGESELAETNIGVVQGGVSSPSTFAIAIDDMLKDLNTISTALALADDIVCHVNSRHELEKVMEILNKWCKKLGL